MPEFQIQFGKGLDFSVGTPAENPKGDMNGTSVQQGQGGAGLGARIQQDAPRGLQLGNPIPQAAIANFEAKAETFGTVLETTVDHIKAGTATLDHMKDMIVAAREMGGRYPGVDAGTHMAKMLDKAHCKSILGNHGLQARLNRELDEAITHARDNNVQAGGDRLTADELQVIKSEVNALCNAAVEPYRRDEHFDRRLVTKLIGGTLDQSGLDALVKFAKKDQTKESVLFLDASRQFTLMAGDLQNPPSQRNDADAPEQVAARAKLQEMLNEFTTLGVPGDDPVEDINISFDVKEALKALTDGRGHVRDDVVLDGTEFDAAIKEIGFLTYQVAGRFKKEPEAQSFIATANWPQAADEK